MGLANYDVARRFVSGEYYSGHSSNNNLWFAGRTLYSYQTAIAYRDDKNGILYLNTRRYSNTTGRHLQEVRWATPSRLRIVEVPEFFDELVCEGYRKVGNSYLPNNLRSTRRMLQSHFIVDAIEVYESVMVCLHRHGIEPSRLTPALREFVKRGRRHVETWKDTLALHNLMEKANDIERRVDECRRILTKWRRFRTGVMAYVKGLVGRVEAVVADPGIHQWDEMLMLAKAIFVVEESEKGDPMGFFHYVFRAVKPVAESPRSLPAELAALTKAIGRESLSKQRRAIIEAKRDRLKDKVRRLTGDAKAAYAEMEPLATGLLLGYLEALRAQRPFCGAKWVRQVTSELYLSPVEFGAMDGSTPRRVDEIVGGPYRDALERERTILYNRIDMYSVSKDELNAIDATIGAVRGVRWLIVEMLPTLEATLATEAARSSHEAGKKMLDPILRHYADKIVFTFDMSGLARPNAFYARYNRVMDDVLLERMLDALLWEYEHVFFRHYDKPIADKSRRMRDLINGRG